jgi:outer membrane protein OmpA-like peptidoglycan-associated protein
MSLKLSHLGVLLLTLALAGCMSPPKPPVVDGRDRQPVNDAVTSARLEQRARLAVVDPLQKEERRQIAILSNRRQAVDVEESSSGASTDAASGREHTVIYRHYFPFAVTRLNLSAADVASLTAWAQRADRVEIRGRTDGGRFTHGDEAVARGRAVSVRQWLLRHGVAPEKININYLSGGDYKTENKTVSGRSQNRRVEVVFFSTKAFPSN